MRKRLIIGISGALVFGLALLAPAVFAKVMTGDSPNVAADQTINDDLFIAGQNVLIEGTVNGDVYAAGNTVTVKGTINGDLIAAGQTITVEGTVRDHVRVAGQSVQLSSATVGSGFSAAGQSITSDSSSTVGGGVLLAGQTINLNGKIGRGVMATANDLAINNEVGGDINAAVKSLSFGSKAVVNGKVAYRSDQDAAVDPAAKLVGGSVRSALPQRQRSAARNGSVLLAFAWLLSSYLVGALAIRVLPRPVAAVSNSLHSRWLASLGIGLVALIVTIPIAVLIMVTVVGIPIGILLLVAFAASLYLSHLVVALVLGNWLVKLAQVKANHYLGLLIGLLVLALIGFIPVIGMIVGFLVLLAGLGALVITDWSYLQASAATNK